MLHTGVRFSGSVERAASCVHADSWTGVSASAGGSRVHASGCQNVKFNEIDLGVQNVSFYGMEEVCKRLKRQLMYSDVVADQGDSCWSASRASRKVVVAVGFNEPPFPAAAATMRRGHSSGDRHLWIGKRKNNTRSLSFGIKFQIESTHTWRRLNIAFGVAVWRTNGDGGAGCSCSRRVEAAVAAACQAW